MEKPERVFSSGSNILVIVISIILASALIFLFLQNIENDKIKTAILERQEAQQIVSTRALVQHVASDLELILTRLELIAASEYLQNEDFDNPALLELMNQQKESINGITLVDYLFVNDKNGIARINIIPEGVQSFVGTDFSSREYMIEAARTHNAFFSNGYMGADGKYRIAMVYPIIKRDTGSFLGVVGISMPTVEFFQHYGNVNDVRSQFLVAFDRNANILAIPSSELIGKSFFGEEVQSNFRNNEAQLEDYRKLIFQGQPSSSIGDFGRGERIATRQPVVILGEPVYFIAISTPTASIYSNIEPILLEGRIESFVVLAATAGAIAVLVIVVTRWNKTLAMEVRKRTKELEDSNAQLIQANQQLQLHDKMQTEFINIAAHELRTPVQPLLGAAEMLEDQMMRDDGKIGMSKPEVEMIIRNAKRLAKLSYDILEVSRIESNSLRLEKEPVSLQEKIERMISEAKHFVEEGRHVEITFEQRVNEPVIVEADEIRLFEVLSNLLRNSIKFTNTGTIRVILDKNANEAVVTIQDTGRGIDPEVMPKLFSRFVSKSESGTGLGLYISKNIIESHGGTITGENNPNGKGATFRFTLPLRPSSIIEKKEEREASEI